MAGQKHYIIYVPGIRDDVFRVQSLLIQCWRIWGVRPVMFSMPWLGGEGFEAKLARLISRIDTYRQQGHQVSLVGASAGASAVLHAFYQRKSEVWRVAYICGKINDPGAVSAQTYARNPAFKTSMLQLQQVLPRLSDADKRKLCSFYSTADATVSYADTVIDGVTVRKLPAVSHMWAILYAISFGSGQLIRALKK